ncbi:MAG: hypothetical protein AAGC73_03325 [Verrucomicrobiota bacterium]
MNDLLKKLSALFKRLSVREKFITLLFVFVIIALWADNLTDRISTLNTVHSATQDDLEYFQSRLDQADYFASEMDRALARVDPSKTYSAIQLSGRIDTLLRQASLAGKSDIDPVKTIEGEIFNDHNIRVRLNRISIAQLIDFHKLIAAETPYINLQSLRLNANRNNREELDARFEINSFELINQNPQS